MLTKHLLLVIWCYLSELINFKTIYWSQAEAICLSLRRLKIDEPREKCQLVVTRLQINGASAAVGWWWFKINEKRQGGHYFKGKVLIMFAPFHFSSIKSFDIYVQECASAKKALALPAETHTLNLIQTKLLNRWGCLHSLSFLIHGFYWQTFW